MVKRRKKNDLKLKLKSIWSTMTDDEKFNLVFLEINRNNNIDLIKELMKVQARNIDDNTDVDERCEYCKYTICSEHDDCFDGIFEKIMDELNLK